MGFAVGRAAQTPKIDDFRPGKFIEQADSPPGCTWVPGAAGSQLQEMLSLVTNFKIDLDFADVGGPDGPGGPNLPSNRWGAFAPHRFEGQFGPPGPPGPPSSAKSRF